MISLHVDANFRVLLKVVAEIISVRRLDLSGNLLWYHKRPKHDKAPCKSDPGRQIDHRKH